MELQGYFTKQGLELAAKLASGAALKITRVTAGAGRTGNPAAAAALPLPKQQLAVNPPLRRGNTAVLPVTLTAALAGSAYELTELGVFAQDPNKGEILYKLYQLPEAMRIDPTSCLVLRFYLEETVSQDLGVTVACSPAGLITEADFAPIRDKIELTETKSRYVELRASELQAYIDALPRFLTEKLSLLVSGELETAVELKHFCGPGLLVVNGKSRGNFTLRNRLFVQNCTVPIHLYNIEFQEREGLTSPLLYVEDSGCVYCYACDFRGLGAQSRYAAVFVDNGSRVRLGSARISGCFVAAEACRASILSVENGVEDADCEFRDNGTGAYVWENGIILLDPKVPDTLGGSANGKRGGLIAKGNGTLL